ncbi:MULTISPECIES: class I SAM-dependent RNA methyltransferase [Peptoniphilus]|mgnify:FL=1|jgi:putative methylase|uniref:THUMP domain-containing class I SAM-dependent RNA methyltransferase n=2 Tax=Peptoniphilaceae TaxID=1570339 RepID=UPI0028FFFDF8|nr:MULTISPECIES: class I SAM-dependent RNA methyltransferase [Peptoniphilus]MDU1044442.1 class I SAM-dependent RNA methyltransferase [Peptoniphilus rhinitidis]MDU2109787.1 class I SAM-dependent RNA methyltransferase [Peptoniphilus lacydonensis]MDU2116224.1 class I SAM-dependent RNA methyltransferase [Peptoniphilus lacydonensis]
MKEIKLIATTNIGLEAVTKRELIDLGYDNLKVSDGKIEINCGLEDIPILNLRLRTAERVLLLIDSFKAETFEELFDKVFEIRWWDYISESDNFIIQGRSRKSKLFSISDCQRITEKAIIEKLKMKYKVAWFEKSGPRVKVEVSLLNDIAEITMDTSGDGLHKRGYREVNYKAPLSETIAASLVKLSFWNKDRVLADPFCGSGTILIEAAMIEKNIAPGLMRDFDFENFKFLNPEIFKEEKKKCYGEIKYDEKLEILASDVSHKAIQIARTNAEILGLDEDISFFQKDIRDLDLPDDYGVLITNPPYGERIGKEDVDELNRELGKLAKSLDTWSFYIITGNENFEKNFGKRADRNRKLYNGRLKTYYYQYYGPKPKR